MSEKSLNFIQDTDFSKGFAVHGPLHEDGFVAHFPSESANGDARWQIAQWGCYKHPLTKHTPFSMLSNGGYTYENETFSITVNPENKAYSVRLEIRSSAEYCGHVRRSGEDWPHLLISQNAIQEYTPYLVALDSLIYQCKLRLDYCTQHIKPDDFCTDLHGAQVHQFLTVQDFTTGDYIWFGIPFFDNRQPYFSGYCGIDSGKADASGSLIAISPSCEFTKENPAHGHCIVYKRDILPLILDALEYAKSKGIMQNARLENMKITSTNIGWEMFAEFDGAFEITDMSLVGYLK